MKKQNLNPAQEQKEVTEKYELYCEKTWFCNDIIHNKDRWGTFRYYPQNGESAYQGCGCSQG
ncbi:hypothetical protein [Bacillus wiedmannii]|uniref:hypothetical protein n=1 Tax=Bacillus wiedmannii TaxID=1890302 RepID=UPI0021CE2E92|nr:hypothetical protein [Bacillus wiedmannii]MCU5096108.1 hypothetical protein [Bacillus wiedmannii]